MDWKPFKVQESQYGEAHWATPAEIKKAGLFHNGSGMTMGMYKGKLLVVDKTNCQHALLFAPTGSGKGVCNHDLHKVMSGCKQTWQKNNV